MVDTETLRIAIESVGGEELVSIIDTLTDHSEKLSDSLKMNLVRALKELSNGETENWASAEKTAKSFLAEIKSVNELTSSLKSLNDERSIGLKTLEAQKERLRELLNIRKQMANYELASRFGGEQGERFGQTAEQYRKQEQEMLYGKNGVDSASGNLEDVYRSLLWKSIAKQFEENPIYEPKKVDMGWLDDISKQNKEQVRKAWAEQIKRQFEENPIYAPQEKQTENLKKLTNQEKKHNSTVKRGLGATLKRIVMYRALRFVLGGLVKDLTTGIKAFAQNDEQANKTMSQLLQIRTQLSNTFGVTLVSALQLLMPAIQTLGDLLATFGDKLNQAMASAQGLTTYTKVLKDETQDYSDTIQAVTTGFDKFETLSGQSNYETETAKVEENVSGIAEFITHIKDTVNTIISKASAFLSKVTQSQGFKNIIKTTDRVLEVVDEIVKLIFDSGLLDLLIEVADALTALTDMFLQPAIELVKLTIQALNMLFGWLGGSRTATASSATGANLETGSSFIPQGATVRNIYGTTNTDFIDAVTAGVSNAMAGSTSQNQGSMAVYLDGKKVGVATAQGAYGEMVRAGYIK